MIIRSITDPIIHAQYGEHEAIIAIDDGEVLEGDLPKPKMKMVQHGLRYIRMN